MALVAFVIARSEAMRRSRGRRAPYVPRIASLAPAMTASLTNLIRKIDGSERFVNWLMAGSAARLARDTRGS
jgi:hypothetical protein